MFDNVLINKIILGKPLIKQDNLNLHIAFGISSNYTRPVGILIKSVLANSQKQNFVFHIFCDGIIEQDELKRYQQLIDEYHTTIAIYYFSNEDFLGLDDKEFTIAAYYRFAIPSHIKEYTDTLLYLDADTVAVGDLNEFKKIDLSKHLAAVVREFKFKDNQVVPYRKEDFYFNSGMMYINIPLWIKEQVSEQCLAILREVNADASKKAKYGYDFRCFDQDALNIVLKDRVIFLEPRFNFLTNISLKANKNLITVPDDTLIIHYHGFNKPWHEWCYHKLNRYYREIAKTSPWSDVPWDNKPTKYRQMRLYAKYYLKQGNLVKAFYWLKKAVAAKNHPKNS